MNRPPSLSPRLFSTQVSLEVEQERLDRWLARRFQTRPTQELSRSRLQELIRTGSLRLNNQVIDDPAFKLKRAVHQGLELRLQIPDEPPPRLTAQARPLDILFEDRHLLVINKSAGLVVHPGAGQPDGTLANAVMAHFAKSGSKAPLFEEQNLRPGIVHRLDKDTTGLMLVAKHRTALAKLQADFAKRKIRRSYLALVWGLPSPSRGVIDAPVGRHPNQRTKQAVVANGRPARTHYVLKQAFSVALSLLCCTLETGRTHQVRVHLEHSGFPLVGDPFYGLNPLKKNREMSDDLWAKLAAFPRQALHAQSLDFTHPDSGEAMAFRAEPPVDMQRLLGSLHEAFSA